MNLIRREPLLPFFPKLEGPFFREMEEMSDRLNRFFGTWTLPYVKEPLKTAEWTPAVDIQESEKEYLIKAELPEVKPEDVQVTFEEGLLTIQGERKQEKEEKGKKFHRMERFYGTFFRTFTLPTDADETRVSAEFKEGMLYVHLAKTNKPRPKTVQVKVAS